MTDDIVARLRAWGSGPDEAADEIERLRAALMEIAGICEISIHDFDASALQWRHQKVACDALAPTQEKDND